MKASRKKTHKLTPKKISDKIPKKTPKKVTVDGCPPRSVRVLAARKKLAPKNDAPWHIANKKAQDLLTYLSKVKKDSVFDVCQEYLLFEFYTTKHGFTNEELKKEGLGCSRISKNKNIIKEFVVMQIQDEPGLVQFYVLACANEVRLYFLARTCGGVLLILVPSILLALGSLRQGRNG